MGNIVNIMKVLFLCIMCLHELALSLQTLGIILRNCPINYLVTSHNYAHNITRYPCLIVSQHAAAVGNDEARQ